MKNPSINKIIITTNEVYTNEKFNRNGISRILQEGYDVELWNEEAFCFEKLPKIPEDIYNGTSVKVKNFQSKREFQDALNSLNSDTLLLCYYPENSDMSSICAAKVKYCNVYGDAFLNEYWYKNMDYFYQKITFHRIKSMITNTMLKLRNKQYRDMLKSMSNWKPIYNFISGAGDYFPTARTAGRESLRFIHTYDYDYYLKDDNHNFDDHNYILFIDEGFGIHPEEVTRNIRLSKNDIDEYRANMRNIFDKLENQTGKEVIIASHPKAEYIGNEFGQRKIKKFQTYELLKHCSFFVQHWSTVTNIGIILNKPMLVVYFDFLDNFFIGNWVKLITNYLGCKIFDMRNDKNNDLSSYIFFNKEKYQQHIHDFSIFDINDHRLNVEIILDEIAKIH